MNQKIRLTVLALSMFVILMLGSVASAYANGTGNSSGTINVVTQCTLSSPELWDAGWSIDKNETQLTVNTEYRVNFTLSDKDGMDDIQNAYVKIWDSDDAVSEENDTDSENAHYTLCWNATHGTWACLGPDPAFYKSGDGSNSSENTQYLFYVNFDLSKVALYSNDGPSYTGWKITINATDGTHWDVLTQCLGFGVAEYMAMSGLAATHQWTSVIAPSNDQPLDDPAAYLSFTVIANRVWNATAKSNATTAHVPGLGYTLGIGNVTQNSVDTAGTSTALSTSEAIIGKDGASPLDAQSVPASETGTACKIYLWVDIPDGLAPGAYVYTLTVTVQKDA